MTLLELNNSVLSKNQTLAGQMSRVLSTLQANGTILARLIPNQGNSFRKQVNSYKVLGETYSPAEGWSKKIKAETKGEKALEPVPDIQYIPPARPEPPPKRQERPKVDFDRSLEGMTLAELRTLYERLKRMFE